MTLFSLALKNIKGNLNNYLLYFFSLIVSVVICYTFNSLLYIPEIKDSVAHMGDMMSQTLFILIGFIIVFIRYSNAFFIKKRKKEVGLYSLLGVRKKEIGGMLFLENLIIGFLTLVSGILLGIISSRVLIDVLLKLLGVSLKLKFTIPIQAIFTTAILFTIITLFTSIQSYRLIYRFKLIELFQANQKGDKIPKPSIILSVFSIALLTGSYWLMFNEMSMLSIPFIMIGTYLLFRSLIISLLSWKQRNKSSYYKGTSIIEMSNLLYRIKGNALMLSIIALLMTVALPYLQAGVYEYRMFEKEVDEGAPFSYIHLSKDEIFDATIEEIISGDQDHPIINQFDIPVIQVQGNTIAPFSDNQNLSINLMSEDVFNQIKEFLNVSDILDVSGKETVAFKKYINQDASMFINQDITIELPQQDYVLSIQKLEEKSVRLTQGAELLYLVVDNEVFNHIAEQVAPIIYKAYEVKNEKTAAQTTETVMKLSDDEVQIVAFYEEYKSLQAFVGMKIFVVSSLAIVLLVATGSVIYFKQLSEAYEDQNRYLILQKIGLSKKEIRKTIIKQTSVIFIFPLIIGVLNAGMLLVSMSLQYRMGLGENIRSFMFAVMAYTLVYFIYYVLTIKSYNKVVNS